MSEELLVRASRDPGASSMADALFSTETPSTAFSMELPADATSTTYGALLLALREKHNATLVGMRSRNAQSVDLNCAAARKVGPCDTLYYISDERLSANVVDWRNV